MNPHICKICGYNLYPHKFWEEGAPNYIICPCCGGESGYEDVTQESIKKHRQRWLDSQLTWFDKSLKPVNWDFKEQIKNIREKI